MKSLKEISALQIIDPGLYQYVEEMRAAEELRSSPYQQALVAAASRRSTHGKREILSMFRKDGL